MDLGQNQVKSGQIPRGIVGFFELRARRGGGHIVFPHPSQTPSCDK